MISGKDKGKSQGAYSFTKDDKIIVEGVNVSVKHKKPGKNMQQGGIIRQNHPYSAQGYAWCDKEKA